MERSPQAMGRRVNIAELDEDRGFRDQGSASSERQSASSSSSSMALLAPALQRRCADGRSARRTGRTVQFATVVSPEFKEWLKVKAAQRGKTQAALLNDMKDAYIEKYGDE